MVLSSRSSRLMRAISCVLYLQTTLTSAQLSVNANSVASIKAATKLIVKDIFSIYIGDQPDQTPGMLPGSGTPDGYYWWVGGGLFGTMVNYWHHTGDETYVEATREAIAFQSAPSEGGYFEPRNETLQLGNDDISFWAFSALMAAEYNFPDPPSWAPSWASMVQGVWNRQAIRWDNACGGGLRWQVNQEQGDGYYYKNSISNGCFFQIGARLAKYTGNDTYLQWAEKAYDWTVQAGLITSDFVIYDGIEIQDGCSLTGHTDQWSYNVGVYLYGAAVMWNHTQQDVWKQRLLGLLGGAEVFLKDETITEVICEPEDSCAIDQSTFKGYLIRWLRATTEVASWTQSQVDSMLQPSIQGAVAACQGPGGDGGVACGQEWYTGSFDGRTGVGMDMNALELFQTLIPASGPLSLKSGAKSKSVPSAGGDTNIDGSSSGTFSSNIINVSTGDRAGASILSILLVVSTIGGAWWVVR